MKTKKKLANPTKYIVFKLIFIILMSWIYLGNFKVQYIICETGNIKLIKKTKKQKEKANKDLYPVKVMTDFDLKPSLDGE